MDLSITKCQKRLKMFKNKANERNNLCGENIRKLRIAFPTKLSQRALADKMQLIGSGVEERI